MKDSRERPVREHRVLRPQLGVRFSHHPHLLLRYYNDVISSESFILDLKWMDKVAKIHPHGLVESGLADHEALQPSPVQLTGTLHYLQCARIMTVFARLMNDRPNTRKFQKLAEHLQTAVQQRFCTQPVDSSVNQQGLYASLLYHQVLPRPDRRAAANALRRATAQGPEGHFTTGIFTTLNTFSRPPPKTAWPRMFQYRAEQGFSRLGTHDRSRRHHPVGDLERERQHLFELSPHVRIGLRMVLSMAGRHSAGRDMFRL